MFSFRLFGCLLCCTISLLVGFLFLQVVKFCFQVLGLTIVSKELNFKEHFSSFSLINLLLYYVQKSYYLFCCKIVFNCSEFLNEVFILIFPMLFCCCCWCKFVPFAGVFSQLGKFFLNLQMAWQIIFWWLRINKRKPLT